MGTAICIIQARRGSSRLPDKILKPLGDKAVLAHVIARCTAIPAISKVIVAVPEGAFDDPIEDLAVRSGAECFRGSERDVLARYFGAARGHNADFVMRVTSDCPLLDPGLCGRLLREIMEKNADYGGLANWPHGLDCEVFSQSILEEAHAQAKSPEDREHVTLWMKRQQYLKKYFLHPEGKALHNANRWVVDYPEDYEFLQAVFALMTGEPMSYGWSETLQLIDKNPELRKINQGCAESWKIATSRIYQSAQDA